MSVTLIRQDRSIRERTWRHTYSDAPDERGMSDLRIQVAARLRSWDVDSDTIDSVELALAELMGNVVRHVRTAPRPCSVVLVIRDTLQLRVHDTDNRIPSLPANPEDALLEMAFAESGRGLCMVACCANRLYFRRHGLGKVAIVEWQKEV